MVAVAVVIVCRVMAVEKEDAPIVITAGRGAVRAEEQDVQTNTIALQNLMFIKHAILVSVVEHKVAPVVQEVDITNAMVALVQGIAMCAMAAERCNATIV